MKIFFNVDTIFCFECVMALKKFIGSMRGIRSVEVEEGKVAVDFDPSVMSEARVSQLVKDSVEKLGYKMLQ